MTKKIAKWLTYAMLGLLALCLTFSLSACGLMPSASDDTADADGDDERREANIYDSYDDSRPNYDEEFDFESGYTPAYTPEGIPVTVTIVLPSEISLSSSYDVSIWETGMTMTMDTLPQEDDLVGYEAYSASHDKHLIGWYVYDEEGNYTRLTSDGMYGVSDTTPLTVYPLFQDNFYDLDVNDNAQNGQSTLNDMGVGSGIVYPTSTSQSNTAAIFETVFNTNDFIEEQMLVYTDGLYVGNWFRINTDYRVDGTVTAFEAGKTYTASYAITNYCDEPIIITLYHASNGWPYNSSSTYRARDFDKDILEMDPGETAYATLTVTYTESVSGGNFLTPVIYGAWYNDTSFEDADCETKKTGISNEGLETITDFRMGIRCHVEETDYVNVRYSLPEGVTFKQDCGYTEDAFETPVNSNLDLPSGDDLVYSGAYADQYLLEWHLADESGKDTGTVITDSYRITSDCVLVAVFADRCTITIEPLDGVTFSYTQAFAAKGGTLKLPSVTLSSDADIYGYYVLGDSAQTIIGQPRETITVTGDMTLCLKIENISTRVTVTLVSGLEDVVTINSLAVEHIHNGEAGVLYEAIYGDGADISYSEYKDFGDTPVWMVSADGGSTWVTVTESYAIPSNVTTVTIKPVYSDIYITVTVDSSVEHFTLTSDSSFKVVYGDTWGQYLSSGEIANNIAYELSDGYLFAYWTVDGTAINLEDEIPYHNGAITLVPVVNTAAKISLELPESVTLSDAYKLPAIAVGGTIYESDLPTTEDFTGIENGREVLGWYAIEVNASTGKTTNVLIGSIGYTIESETVTVAPYWSRVTDSYEAQFSTGASGDPVFNNEQSNSKPNKVDNGLSQSDFTALPERYENVYPVSAGGGYAELGTYFSYNGTMPVGGTFRCTTFIDSGDAVVTKGVEHAFIYTFENIGTTDIWLSMQLVNDGTNVEGDTYYIYLKPGESIQFTIVMAFTNGDDNHNIMAYFTVDKEMDGMSMAASVSLILANSMSMSTGYVTNAANDIYKEKHTLTYVLPEGAYLSSSFNEGSETLIQFREDGIVLPTAENIILSDGSDARYKKLTWYVEKDGQYTKVKGGEDFEADTTIYLKIEDITVSVTVDFSNISGIRFADGDSKTFDAVYGELWSEYLNESSLGYTLEAGYFVAGWQTSSGEVIDLLDIVPSDDVSVKPIVEYADVKITIGSVSGVMVNVNEIDAYVGANLLSLIETDLASGTLVVTTDSDIMELKGWSLADGELIGSDYTVSDNVTIYPIIGYKSATVTIKIEAEGVDIEFTYDGNTYTNGQSIELQATCMENLYNLISSANISGKVITEGFEFLEQWKMEDGTPITEGTTIDTVSVTVYPVISRKNYSVLVRTIYDDDGNVVFSVAGYDNTYVRYGETFSLPAKESENITNNTGKDLIGWVIKYSDGTYSVSYTYSGSDSTGSVVSSSGVYSLGADFVMPAGDIEILPLLYESDEYIPHELDYFDNASGSAKSDNPKDAFTTGVYYSEVTYETDYFIKLNDGYTMDDGDYIRYKNKYSVTSGTTYDFYYTITNLGSTDLTIKIYQMNSSANITNTGTVSAESEQIVIKVGETVTVSLLNVSGLGEAQSGGSNNNTLTIIQTINGTMDFYLGINERIDVHEDATPASAVSTYSCEASLEPKRREN